MQIFMKKEMKDENGLQMYTPFVNEQEVINTLVHKPDEVKGTKHENEARAYLKGLTDMTLLLGNSLTGRRPDFIWEE